MYITRVPGCGSSYVAGSIRPRILSVLLPWPVFGDRLEAEAEAEAESELPVLDLDAFFKKLLPNNLNFEEEVVDGALDKVVFETMASLLSRHS